MNARLSPQDMDRLSGLMMKMAHSDKPGVRAQLANLVSQVDPQSAKAFTDVQIDAKLNQFMRKFNDDRLKERMDQVAAGKERQKQEVIRERKLNADQVKVLENIQTHYGFSDWKAAADIYAQRNPPVNKDLVPPPELKSSTWDFPTVPDKNGKMLEFKDYIKDPRKYSNDTAYQMISEFKRGRLPAAFQGA